MGFNGYWNLALVLAWHHACVEPSLFDRGPETAAYGAQGSVEARGLLPQPAVPQRRPKRSGRLSGCAIGLAARPEDPGAQGPALLSGEQMGEVAKASATGRSCRNRARRVGVVSMIMIGSVRRFCKIG
jgi:hypothetical protein